MDQQSLLLVLSLLGLKLTGFGTAYLVNRGHRTVVTRLTLWYWALNFVSFLVQGIAGQDPLLACIAVIAFIPPMLVFARLSDLLFQTKTPRKLYFLICTTGVVIGLTLWFITKNFFVSAALCSWPIGACILHFSWLIYVSKAQKPAEALILLLGLILCGLHVFDYPILRLNVELQGAGFALAYFVEMVQLLGLTTTVAGQIRLAYTTRLEHDILAASKDLRNSEETKTNLIRILCHDVANGLMILQQSFQRLQSLNTEENGAKALRAGKLALDSQLQLLENVRTAVSVSTGKIRFNVVAVDLHAAANAAIVNMNLAAENKTIRIVYREDPGPVIVYADETLLVQSVIGNLLSNAIKFSNKGGEVHIEIKKPGLFIIRDFGQGMDSEKLSKLFDISTPTNSLGTLGESGTGFGMIIVHNLLTHMGATIHVESQQTGPTTGTEFKINFRPA